MSNPHPTTNFTTTKQNINIAGRSYQNKGISAIANLNKSLNLNQLQDTLYRWSCAILEYSFTKRPLKEILPVAKEIYRVGPPQTNVSVSIMLHGDLGDLGNLEGLYNHIRDNKGKVDMKQVEGNEEIVK